MTQRVLVVATDLMFQARIADAVRALGAAPLVIDAEVALASALAEAPSAAVIDLHERSLDALAAIGAFRSAGVPVLAFGRHTEPGLLRAARDAGAQSAVPRSQLVDELPDLLGDLLGTASG